MSTINLTDPDDDRLASYRDLPQSHSSRRADRFIVEGRLLVERLARSALSIESVLVDRSRLSLLPAELIQHAALPIYVLPDESICRLVGFDFHRGVLACARRPSPSDSYEVRAFGPGNWLGLVVDRVDNPENLGALLRSAAAFGVDEVLLGRGTVDPWSRRVVRVSMGAVFTLRMRDGVDLETELVALTQGGVQVAAMVADDEGTPLPCLPCAARRAVVVGQERSGIAECLLTLCHDRVTIPMQSNVDSLNVAAAAAIALYSVTAARRG